MIDVMPILKIAPVFLVALALPGPDFFMISSLSLSRGRWAGFQAACGIALGNFIWAALCLWGLGMVIAKLHGVLIAIRLCGGAYLLYLGYQLWKSSFRAAETGAVVADAKPSRRSPFAVGVMTNLTNPKAIAFFTSIFALALPPQATGVTQAAILALIAGMSVAWFGLVSFCLSAPAMRGAYMRWSRWIDRVAGTFLAFFGARLLLSSRN